MAAVAAGAALAWTVPLLRSQSSPPPAPSAPAAGGHEPARRRSPTVDSIERTRDAIVNIHSERTAQGPATEELFALAPSQNRINGMGTGILVDPRGYLVTNQHVVEDVQVIRVRLRDGTLVSARVLARDPESDLALLKIDVGRPLPVMPLGTATDLLVGETVITVGNAYGYENTASQGIVSAVGRDVTLNKDVQYKQLIQTDACINPGNSGGPLLNVRGELVGVNVAIRAGAQCIGFAIPVDSMIRATAAMMAGRTARNGVAPHGLAVRDEVRRPDEEAPFVRQAVVERVEPGSAAANAGLQRGDVLVRAGDVAVGCGLDLERAFVEANVGDRVPVVVRRGGGEQRAELTLEARPAPAAAPAGRRRWRLAHPPAAARRPGRHRRAARRRRRPGRVAARRRPGRAAPVGDADARQRPVRGQPPRPGHVQPDPLLRPPRRPGAPRHAPGRVTAPRVSLPPSPRPPPGRGLPFFPRPRCQGCSVPGSESASPPRPATPLADRPGRRKSLCLLTLTPAREPSPPVRHTPGGPNGHQPTRTDSRGNRPGPFPVLVGHGIEFAPLSPRHV